ncbi:ABC transporter ATP-binding protein [Methanosarcina sp. 2.H.T.1A.6]|uniref:ATP-binding cassette domain-containing protein n=1 Tax=unclassified Methanosarcina TaxID=2644672 RepID=UPI0006211E15|nr:MULTISPECIES: ATP-binding cassette domain-containing protein [unclassified Methanosarcina]KKG12164.1 ABC transporter ATP-binding protein [Methanosarcina sp. 2.H.T.1A.15]KKG17029.1 ABC transporter ATP-binding protein [Methanosarcina sp. 2.H.T.1A.3]KKG20347.1 ABC transporter ATP-binding protein [Methanosarcina sp. 2.H.T.1A.6]KKG23388.1 ABC transporter ATP-binding protein [Methanosarcina sp. 2.H.T.1A.8]
MSAIIIKELTKKFGEFTAVDSVSFSVEPGELFGLLGPNGAGKTTIINMLTTLLLPTAGDAEIAGYDLRQDPGEVRNNIGIIFQDPSLDIGLTGRENLEFHAMMYNIGSDERKKRIREVLDVVGLADKADILVENYSGGMKRRLEIARGLIHYPKVLFLDEPTLGLDAQTRRSIWDHIRNLNRNYGTSVILTTHYMEEADFLCDRIAIIDHGKIIALDTPSGLKNCLRGDCVSLTIEGRVDLIAAALGEKEWVKEIVPKGKTLDVILSDYEKNIPDIFQTASNLGIEISSINFSKPSLEDVFIRLTGSIIREQEGSRQSVRRDRMRRRMLR